MHEQHLELELSTVAALVRDQFPQWAKWPIPAGALASMAAEAEAARRLLGLTPADPALDLMPAWNLLDARARLVYRNALGADDAQWDRGKGWAFAQAIGCLYYYRNSNPPMSRIAARTLNALLADGQQGD